MSKHIPVAALREAATISDRPAHSQVDRTLGLPVGLYVATAACYFGFLAIMWIALKDPRLAIPMVICFVFVAMFGGTVAKWVRMDPPNSSRAASWAAFVRSGIATHTGHLPARDAALQVLAVPVLILMWSIIIAVIRSSLT